MRHVSKLTGWTHHAQHRDEGPHCSPREARRIVRHVRVRAGYARVLCSWAKVDGPGGRSNATLCCRPVGKWPVACGLSPFCTSAYPAACCLQYRYGRRKDGWPGDVCVCAPPVDGRVPLLTYTYVRRVLHDEVRAEWPSGRIHCDASAAVVRPAKH